MASTHDAVELETRSRARFLAEAGSRVSSSLAAAATDSKAHMT
jgi:hypothetical protein